MTEHNLQEQPESTIGRKPHEAPPARSPAPPPPQPKQTGEEPFARARFRREEAEESDIGGEIRDRDEHDTPLILGEAGAGQPS